MIKFAKNKKIQDNENYLQEFTRGVPYQHTPGIWDI